MNGQRIESTKNYKVRKFTHHGDFDYGVLTGADVKRLIHGYTYWKPDWEETGMWFSKSGIVAYDIVEQ